MKLLRPIGRIALWLGVSFVALSIIGAISLWFFLPDLCANGLISELSSPDGGKRLVVFQRDCGATTGFSTQASVLPSSTPLPNKGGNLYVSDTNHGAAPSGPGGGPNLKVTWISNQSVVLTHHPNVRVLKSEAEVDGVRASYVTAE
ncbi:MAG: hypothetical protein EPO57_09325 [Chitinophagaceae bacterium]|nr:MAG: hypothetical protein EPO57_09325 [Chitinophagaceae bacterium]